MDEAPLRRFLEGNLTRLPRSVPQTCDFSPFFIFCSASVQHDAVQRELFGLTALDRVVEDGTVDELAFVVTLTTSSAVGLAPGRR
jgi:hypothetical protein